MNAINGSAGNGSAGNGSADVHTLAGGYALDALDANEVAAFEAHLRECAACAVEVAGLRETAAVLGFAVATPAPSAMRARVMAQIARTPQLPPEISSEPQLPAEVSPGPQPRERDESKESGPTAGEGRAPHRIPGRRRSSALNRAFALAAALAVLLTGGLGALGWQRAHTAEEARQQLAQAVSIASDPSAQRQTASVTGGGQVVVVVSDGGAAVLADGLADPGDGKIYQLWINHPGEQNMRSAGLGPAGQAASSNWARLVEGMKPGDAFALSIEPEGGSQAPTTDPVVLVNT